MHCDTSVIRDMYTHATHKLTQPVLVTCVQESQKRTSTAVGGHWASGLLGRA